jgi:hypothetical protein
MGKIICKQTAIEVPDSLLKYEQRLIDLLGRRDIQLGDPQVKFERNDKVVSYTEKEFHICECWACTEGDGFNPEPGHDYEEEVERTAAAYDLMLVITRVHETPHSKLELKTRIDRDYDKDIKSNSYRLVTDRENIVDSRFDSDDNLTLELSIRTPDKKELVFGGIAKRVVFYTGPRLAFSNATKHYPENPVAKGFAKYVAEHNWQFPETGPGSIREFSEGMNLLDNIVYAYIAAISRIKTGTR